MASAKPTAPVFRAAVVYNPVKVDLTKLEKIVAAAEEDAGWAKTLWFATTEEDPGQGQAEQAVAKGASVVIAAGGDGTVRAVAESLRGGEVALAVLPSGTGNLLARNLAIPLDSAESAVSIAFIGTSRPIDLGVVDFEREDGSRGSNVFLVMAGLGLDAQMIANTNPRLKARVGWLAYVDAIARSLRDKNSIRGRFRLDGAPPQNMSAHTILIGNCGLLPANIVLLPDAHIDDGILDVVALRPKGFAGWVQIWIKIVWENGVLRRSQVGRTLISLTREVRALRYATAKELILRLDKPHEFELDGDAFGRAVALKTWVDPLALFVRVAQSSVD